MAYWSRRLTDAGVRLDQTPPRFDEKVIAFPDPDGLRIELIGTAVADSSRVWQEGPVPVEHAIRGFHAASLVEEGHDATVELLTTRLGFWPVAREGTRFRFAAGAGGPGQIVDVVCAPGSLTGRVAAGTVHHIAFRTPDDAQQVAWREVVSGLGYSVSPVMDRTYFHSIYFREPGGILFEVATDVPGFAVDEAAAALGSRLILPKWLEGSRPDLERRLPRLTLPVVTPGGRP